MRRLGTTIPAHASRNRDDWLVPDRQGAGKNEAYQVLWEIGVHLAAFLGIALVVNELLVIFGVAILPA